MFFKYNLKSLKINVEFNASTDFIDFMDFMIDDDHGVLVRMKVMCRNR